LPSTLGLSDAAPIVRGQLVATLAVLAAALAAGCDRVPRNAIESCSQEARVLPAQTDLLVVVDDSNSMDAEQENLRQNLADFIAALAESPVPNDFRIAVTTTDVHNTHGMSPAYPYWVPPFDSYGYEVPFPQGALVAVDPGALTDPALRGKLVYDQADGFGGARILSPTQEATFEANVLVGVLGSDKEEPLRAVELALTDRIADGANAGFLRPGARLGIIVLTDEDDCSERVAIGQPLAGGTNELCHDPAVKATGLESLADFRAFLDGPIAGEARDPVVAVIAGFDPDTLAPTGCATSYDAPTRLASLLDDLGEERSFRGSICDRSFGPSLTAIADLLVPQTVPIAGAPPDARMLLVSVERRDGSTVRCPVAAAGAAGSAQAGAVYVPPQAGRGPTLTFQGICRLRSGDRVRLAIVCAG
jgi:hypothetical protein